MSWGGVDTRLVLVWQALSGIVSARQVSEQLSAVKQVNLVDLKQFIRVLKVAVCPQTPP